MNHVLAEYSFENLLFLTFMLQFEEFLIDKHVLTDTPSNRILSRRINLPSLVPKAPLLDLVPHRTSRRPFSVYSVDSNSARHLPGLDMKHLDDDLDPEDAVDTVQPSDRDDGDDDGIEIICAEDEVADEVEDVVPAVSPSFSGLAPVIPTLPTISTNLQPTITPHNSVPTRSRTTDSTPSVDSEVKRAHTVDMLKDRSRTDRSADGFRSNSVKNGKSVHWDHREKSIQSQHSAISAMDERTMTHTVTPTVIKIPHDVNDLNAKMALIFCTVFKKYIARDKAELELNVASEIREGLTAHFKYVMDHGQCSDLQDCWDLLLRATQDVILNLNDSLSRFRFYQKQIAIE